MTGAAGAAGGGGFAKCRKSICMSLSPGCASNSGGKGREGGANRDGTITATLPSSPPLPPPPPPPPPPAVDSPRPSVPGSPRITAGP